MLCDRKILLSYYVIAARFSYVAGCEVTYSMLEYSIFHVGLTFYNFAFLIKDEALQID